MMDCGLKANNHLLQLFLVILFLAFVVGHFLRYNELKRQIQNKQSELVSF